MDRNQIKRRVLYVDQDSEDRALPDGACRYILNTRTVNTDQSSDGSGENVISNVLVNNPYLGAGNNTAIGTFSDNIDNTIVYCVYNSLGNHGVFRYYPDNGTIEKIIVNPILGFTKENKITGINIIGDLFYWTDGNVSPRKISLLKANNTGKQFVNNVYLNNDFLVNAPVGFIISITSGDFTIEETLTVGPGVGKGTPSLENLAEFISDGINANSTISNLITAESCGIYLSVTTKSPEITLGIAMQAILATGNQTLVVVADNYYPTPYKLEYVERVKYPFECEPEVSVQQDPTRVVNLLENKVFQFRLQIYYDDFEKSAWGPASVIPSIPLSCNQATAQNPYNYIEVNFDTDRFNDLGSLSIIRGVNVAVRELNIGDWKLVTQLSKAQFISNGNIYKFYNDVIPETLDGADAAKWFDSVGLKVKSQTIANDRIFDGGITEGYDNVCVDASLSVAYEQNVKQDTFTIKGDLFIRNVFDTDASYMAHQPIHNDGSGIGFGGFLNNNFVDHYISEYKQELPLGGFVMYLAGTPYYGVSVQYQGNPPGETALQTNGVYNSNSNPNSNRNTIRNAITGNGSIVDPGFPPTRVGSYWTIPNVPPGKYILRIAGHTTTQSDLDEPNLNWQKTSTHALAVAGEYSTECLLEVKSNGDIVIGSATYSQGTSLPPTAIADLTYRVSFFDRSWCISGYVVDNDGAADPINDTRVELSIVEINRSANGVNSIWNQYGLGGNFGKTDHNGFFYFTSTVALIGDLNVNNIICGSHLMNPAATSINGGAFIPPTAATMRIGVFRNTNGNVSSYSRTKITGNISYLGRGIQGVSIICSRGRPDSTDRNGDFDIFVYVDTSVNPVRSGYLFFGLQDTCIATFSSTSEAFNIAISSSNYNISNTYTIADVTITGISSGTSASALKRGGKYNLGIVYLDQANRSNFVGTSEDLRLQIPFYTQNSTGGGKPSVSWQIKNLPPEWATHYQWVRTVNGNQGRFLQWTADAITYLDERGNPVGSYVSGTQIQIDLASILTYKNSNVDSLVSYQYEEGDRLVFIKDPNGNFFGNYFDLKIKGVKAANPLVIYVENLVSMGDIQPGPLFEIYNPNKALEEQFYYEFGECFEIGEANGIKYHKGLTQDQSPTDPSGTPATGTFRNGDVWVRSRRIPYGTSGTIKLWQIEDQSISDFYPSLSSSIGRPHIVDKENGQIYNPGLMRFSNKFIPGSKVNGLSSFEALNQKQLPQSYGLINKLILSKDVLLAVCDNSETVSMYLSKSVITDLSAQNLVAISNKVISDTYEYQGSLGTQHPESVQIDSQGNVYGWDSNKGILWKRTGNGLEPISSIDNRTYFRNKSKDFISRLVKNAPAVYDVAHDQFIISFPPDVTLADFNGNGLIDIQDFFGYLTTFEPLIGRSTFAFNNTLRRWETFFSFVPEYYGNAQNNIVVSFVDGKLYRHENTTTYNNFYGTQYTQQVSFILNDAPSIMKRWLAVSIESNKAWSAPTITTPHGQQSSLEESDFELMENTFRADLLRDQNTPVENPLIFGDDLLGETVSITLSNSHTDYCKIYALNGNFIVSQTSNQ